MIYIQMHFTKVQMYYLTKYSILFRNRIIPTYQLHTSFFKLLQMSLKNTLYKANLVL